MAIAYLGEDSNTASIRVGPLGRAGIERAAYWM
jgi:hypothetical protein